MSKAECVQRARNLNQQAIGYRMSGQKRLIKLAVEFCERRDELIAQARAA